MGNSWASCCDRVEDETLTNEASNTLQHETNNSNSILSPPFQDQIVDLKLMSREKGDGKKCLNAKNDGTGEKGVVRVKILLTKQELAQLMSMCNQEQGVLGALVSELKEMEMDQVSSISRNSSSDSWKPVLEMIPEESETSIFRDK